MAWAVCGARPAWRQIWQETRAKFATRLFTILVITIPIYVGVFLAQEGGLFGAFRQYLTRLVAGTPIPVEGVSILIFSLAAETTGGFAAAGALSCARTPQNSLNCMPTR